MPFLTQCHIARMGCVGMHVCGWDVGLCLLTIKKDEKIHFGNLFNNCVDDASHSSTIDKLMTFDQKACFFSSNFIKPFPCIKR